MTVNINEVLSGIKGWDPAAANPTPLGGGITNQNFRIRLGHKDCVVRLYGEDTSLLGINRDQEIACHGVAAQLGIAPQIVEHLPQKQALITEFIQGKTLEAADVRKNVDRIVSVMKLYHRGSTFSGDFSPFETIRGYANIARDKGVALPDTLSSAVEFCDQIEVAFSKYPDLVPCHNDLLAANFIDDGKKIWLLDWEYAGHGPRFFDLANLAINNEFTEEHDHRLLRCYFGEVKARDIAKLNLMKLVSDLRESFWSFVQCGISKLDFDYHTYAIKHFDRFMSGADNPRFRSWLEALG